MSCLRCIGSLLNKLLTTVKTDLLELFSMYNLLVILSFVFLVLTLSLTSSSTYSKG